ncbi:uncharacterized protein LOC133306684 [Gastrolobium bilobum]|uniref:uncharacterized protein LOC133306684 n=1 Tax=Gastrolobium bilobum TaxID=150636 RepID=UPI002AB30E23|nr:uncharacterized protein LOC133306684 [Gastrolobium bilobum]
MQDNAEEIARWRLKDFRNFQPPTFEGGDNPETAARCARALLRAQNVDLTWAMFRRVFLDKYFPKAMRRMKHTELLSLRQDNMTVNEYISKFGQLMEYANFDRNIYDEEWQVEKYESGLHPEIRKLMLTTANRTLPELINQSRQAEEIINEAKNLSKQPMQSQGGSKVGRFFRKITGMNRGKGP